MVSRILKSNAIQKLATENPSISLSAKSMIKALMTNKNNPKVKMVAGNVKIINIGFTNKFNSAKTTATMIAVT